MKKHHHLWIILSVAFLFACGDANEDDPQDEPPLLGGPRRVGDVGQGYDSINRTIKPQYCIQPKNDGRWPEVGLPSSTISMTLQSDRTKIARSLGIDADISYGIYSAAASFLRETESDDLSVSYIFGGTINFKDVQVGGNYEVNPNLLDADVVKWYRLCGDSYVQRITRGASLYAALKFHFSDRLEKQQFESSFKVKGGLSVSAALKEAQKVSQQSVQVSVFAVQVGGNVAELSSALSEVEVATCGMASIDHCLGYLQAIEHYASHSFPKQFVDDAGRPLTGAALDTVTATTHYESAPWHTLAIPHLPDLSDKPQATKLLQLYLKQFALKEKIGIILNLPVLARRGDEMAVIQREVLEADAVAVSQNIAAIGVAWEACYPTVTSGCAEAMEAAEWAIQEIPPTDLVPWFEGRYDDGTPGHPDDLIDIDGDGSVDLCWAYMDTIRCLMGVGLGFEEMPSRYIVLPSVTLWRRPWLWLDLGGQELHLAFCVPPSFTQAQLECHPVVNGTIDKRPILLRRYADGSVDVLSSRNTAGIDGKKVFDAAVKKFKDRWGDFWDAVD